MIDALSTYINGCELDQVSTHDSNAYEDTEINWRIRKGLWRVDRGLRRAMPGCPELQGDAHRPFGETRAARDVAGHAFRRQGDRDRATNLIADEAIRFHPRCLRSSMRRAACARPRRQGDAGAGISPTRCRRTAICRGATCARRWAAFICARSASPVSKAISADALRGSWKTTATARWQRKASTRSWPCWVRISAAN